MPRWLTSAGLESGALRGPNAPRLLVLPQTTALSDREAAEIRAFAASGGRIWAIGTPGTVLITGASSGVGLFAAKALVDHTELDAETIVRQSLAIAGELCIYTNMNHTIEVL
jgi:ATP-dependent protease HslVU (ClpYQ) peptidase subunit